MRVKIRKFRANLASYIKCVHKEEIEIVSRNKVVARLVPPAVKTKKEAIKKVKAMLAEKGKLKLCKHGALPGLCKHEECRP